MNKQKVLDALILLNGYVHLETQKERAIVREAFEEIENNSVEADQF